MALVEQVLVGDLAQRPPHGLDVGRVERPVGVVEVDPEADALGQRVPVLQEREDRLAALLVELGDAVGLDLRLGGDAELLLDRDLHRQPVRVPAALALDEVAAHGLEAGEDVLEHARRARGARPGRPFAVGGPSQNTHGSAPARRRIDSWKTSRSRQRSSTWCSRSGKACWGSTARRAIGRWIVGRRNLRPLCDVLHPCPSASSAVALTALALLPGGAAAATLERPEGDHEQRHRLRARRRDRLARRARHHLRAHDPRDAAHRVPAARDVRGAFARIVIVDQRSRDQSPALTYTGHTATVAWVRADHSGRVVAVSRVSPRGVVSGPQTLGGTPAQYEPRFPDPAQLLFNTRATSTVSRLAATGKPTVGVKLPRGATFDATVAVLPNGDRLALWSEKGRVYTAREVRGTFKFTRADAPVGPRRLRARSEARGDHRRPRARALAPVRRRAHGLAGPRRADLRRLARDRRADRGRRGPERRGHDGRRRPGDLRVLARRHARPDRCARCASIPRAVRRVPSRPSRRPGERARSASLAVDTQRGVGGVDDRGPGPSHDPRRADRRAAGSPRRRARCRVATAPRRRRRSIALSLRGRGIVAWATASGRIHAVTRAGL